MKEIIITIMGFSITFVVYRLSAFSLEALYFRCLTLALKLFSKLKAEILKTISKQSCLPSLFLIK